jgi:hypothetical protein
MPRGMVVLPVVLAAAALAGCTTTQHEAQRVRLDSARLRSALAGTRVRVQGKLVRPTTIEALRSQGHVAVVVTVRNTTRREVTDLPISVGYINSTGARVYLNAAAGLLYYDAHLPAIPAGSRLTWVFTTSAKVPAGARLFALVGASESVPALLTDPGIHLNVRVDRSARADSITVHLDNPTSVPQYQLQLYATAADDGRYVAAGNATVSDLGAGSAQSVTLSLVGPAQGAKLRVTAVPTILQ